MPSADPQPIPTTTSPSPPPSPNLKPPTAQTPGPRATAFLKLYDNALTSTIKSIPYESFASCFPTIASANPDALRGMHKGMMEKLDGFARGEFESICGERRVVRGLNGLEGVIDGGRRARERAGNGEGEGENGEPPHLLPPSQIITAHLTPVYTSQQNQLNAKLQTIQSQNALWAEKVVQQRMEIEALVGLLEGVVGDLEAAGGRLVEGEGLDGEAREAEEVMIGMERT